MSRVTRRSDRLYGQPLQALREELAKPCPRPPELLRVCEGICQWVRYGEHTWARVREAGAIPTIARAVDHLQGWPSGVVEDQDEVDRMVRDLAGGEGSAQPGVLHVLIALAEPMARSHLRDEYHRFFRLVAHELGEISSSSSDSSNPHDPARYYNVDMEESSFDSADSSNPREPPGAREERSVVGLRGDHHSLVALTEYAQFVEYVRSQPNGAGVVAGFRRSVRSLRARGEYPFHPLPEGLVEGRFHVRHVRGFWSRADNDERDA